MKYINFRPSDFGNPSRFCYLVNRLDATGGEEEIDLTNPTKVSLADIRHMRDQAGDLEKEEVANLNHLVEYHISLADQDDGANEFPSRIVWEVFHSPLAQRLSPGLRMKVGRILRIKRDELAQFAEMINKGRKDIKDLNDVELIKMNRAFTHLRTYTDNETKKIRETLQGKMIEIGAKFLQGYVIEHDEEIDEDIIVRLPETPEITSHQRLWILELYRNFSQSHFWPERNDPKKIKMLAKDAVKEINKLIVLEGSDEQQNLKSMVLFWDVLEELDQIDADFEDIFSTESKQRIRRFVERGNQAQFLDWADRYFNGNPKVLLEDHLRALIDIRDNERYRHVADPNIATQYQQRYQAEKEDENEAGISDEEKAARTQRNTEKKKALDKEQAEAEEKSPIRQLFRDSEDTEETQWIIEKEERDEYKKLKGEIDELKQGKKVVKDDGRETFVDGILDLDKTKKDKGLTNEQEATLKSKQKELEEKEKRFDEIKGKIDREKKFTSTWDKRAKLFLGPGKKAHELIEKYREDIKSRAKSGQLHAADMGVIFTEDQDPEIAEVFNEKVTRDDDGNITAREADPVIEEGLKDFLLEARDNIGDVLEELAGDITFEVNPQSLSVEDRFATWNRQLDRALSTSNVLKKLEDIDGDDEEGFYRQLIDRSLHKKEVTIKELVDASVQHHRDSIFDALEGSLPVDEQDAETFIGQYGRLHQTLKDSDTYQNLKERRTELEQRQTEFYADSQEAQKKVYEIFPNTEWTRVWNIAEPMIDEFAWQDIADQMLIDDDDLDREIKKEEAIKQAFIDFGTVNRWNIHPQSMEDFWRALLKPGTPNNFYQHLLEESSVILNDTLARDEISEAIQYNHERLSGGEHTEYPGEKLLNEVEIQVMPYRLDIYRQFAEYKKHFQQIQDSFDHNPEALQSTRSLVMEVKNDLVPYIRSQSDEIKEMLQQLAPDKTFFVEKYLESIEREVGGLESACQLAWTELQRRADDDIYPFSKDDEVFMHIPGLFDQIDRAFSFTEGERGQLIDKHFDDFKESQKKVPEVATFLKDELELFDAGGREKARAKYESIQQQYSSTFNKFDENYKTYVKRINVDMKTLTDDQFKARHGESKMDVGKNMTMLERNHLDFQRVWTKYSDENFFSNWLRDYENPQTRADALSEFDFWDTLKNQQATMSGLNDSFGEWINAHNESWTKEDGRGLAGKWHKGKTRLGKFILDDVQWYSINGIWGMFKDAYELTQRLSERRIENEKAKLGKAIFGEKGVWGLGHEFTRKATESEEARVDEYKNRYKRWKVWDIKKELYDVKGPGEKDKARALIDLLVEKGQVRWNDPEFWYVLNRLNMYNSGIPQFTPKDIEKDQGEIRDLVRIACEAVWDDYVFAAWEGSLPGNYENAVKSSFNKFDNMETYGDREAVWADMLDKWRRGVPDETTDPAEYEGFLSRAFENGKVNGQPDRRWFYLIMGMTVKNPRGETLVSREMLDRFDSEHLQTVPYFDFFTDKTSPKKNGKIVPEGTPGAHTTWTFEDLQAWGNFFGGSEGRYGFHANDGSPDANILQSKCHEFFYNYICTSDNALMRVDRMNRNAKSAADHDDAQMWFAGMSFQGMAQVLNRASEGTDLVTPDFAGTFLQGFDLYMKATYEYIMKGDAEYGSDHEGWKKLREKRLLQTGQRMRVGFGALHTMAGNYEANGQQSPLTLDQSFWNQNKYDISTSRDLINDTVKDLLKENGKDLDEFEGIWNYVGTKEVSENSKERRNNSDWKKMNNKLASIVGSEDQDLGGSYFEEIGAVEKVLKRYALKHGGMYNTGVENEKPKFLYQEEKKWQGSGSGNGLGLAA